MAVFITYYEKGGNSDIENYNDKIKCSIWQSRGGFCPKKSYFPKKSGFFRVKFQNSSRGSYYTSFCSILATESRGHNFKIIKRN